MASPGKVAIKTDYDGLQNVADFIKQRIKCSPIIGLVAGSGLGHIAKDITDAVTLKYAEIPGFPVSTAIGHEGNLVCGLLSGRPVVCMQGRLHTYEGYTPAECAAPIRVMHLLGVKFLIVTNASGGLNPDYQPGDILLLKDHVCLPALTGLNPLIGPNDDRQVFEICIRLLYTRATKQFGTRFPAMDNCYDVGLAVVVKNAAEKLGLKGKLREGVYAMISGPAYATKTESALLRTLGGDAIGMSNCWEVMIARHCGMKIMSLCVITDM
ncbi:unnamed protein product [Soboliphyme baturini]|uniref:Purine nucleoside phosphorylase n=1 Tax=Soboliphyme baturini TaxID=241478 RepID=A0A183J4V2_9BILA|nr:unnamed protein product [Soboliphyme baturini]